MKIGVIGCGNVGFAHLKWMLKSGFIVKGYDIDLHVREKIQNEMGKECIACSLADIADCDSIHICVPTEPLPDGSADMAIYDSVINELSILLDGAYGKSIVQRSTCLPGTADSYASLFNDTISYGVNPSFLRKASIIEDTEKPERIAIGGNGIFLNHMEEIYRKIEAPRFITNNKCVVELLKYVENTLDALLISYWNEILEYATKLGMNTDEMCMLLEQIGDRPKFKTSVRVPGKAFGMWCLPKDLNALIISMKEKGIYIPTLEGVMGKNMQFIKEVGYGIISAQELWNFNNNKVQILPEGKKQIDHFIKGNSHSI